MKSFLKLSESVATIFAMVSQLFLAPATNVIRPCSLCLKSFGLPKYIGVVRPRLNDPCTRSFASKKWKYSLRAQGGGGRSSDTDSTVTVEINTLQQKSKEAMANVMKEARELAATRGSGGFSGTEGLKERLGVAMTVMEQGLVERETEVRLLLLSALSGEHILFIGPPGTAKSELGRRLSNLCEGQFFERLLTRFSVPEELFGPLSMRALEDDQYIRQTEGYLPQATVAFVDEIFKANSAILNTLLTVLNERLFDNGSERVPVPLLCMVGASNELPESEELDALYDRFLVRKEVRQVSGGGLVELLEIAGNNPDGLTMNGSGGIDGVVALLGERDFVFARMEARKSVKVPREVIDLLADLRTWLQEQCEPPVYLSDRRLVKAVGLMQVAAFTDGRDTVSQYDCMLLQHVFWNQPDEADRIYDWLLGRMVFDDGIEQVHYLISGIFGRACKFIKNKGKIADLLQESKKVRELLVGKMAAVLQSVDGGFPLLTDNVWLSHDDREAIVNALLPRLQKSKSVIEDTLYEVVALEVALEENVDAVLLATLMPKRWAEFIREGPKDAVEKLGTVQRSPPSRPPL
ncbi:hypothetical protein BSKO_00460 [Bryopsis sp. KO-2023]|nr:hypothetical protein BSKO_00460 [Bryopsis sp. KO-2023]